ncbi:MAG: N-acetylmuramoyl-L-alanine amidase, partial [Chloroflexota bacterium]|nr:N-acetylmuramoyl-L-alanine amidase [Chloroflexota bacterium]
MKICIDPGHGGTDPGAIGTAPAAAGEPALTLKECDFTLDVALLLEEELARRGQSVLLTRRRDPSRPRAAPAPPPQRPAPGRVK